MFSVRVLAFITAFLLPVFFSGDRLEKTVIAESGMPLSLVFKNECTVPLELYLTAEAVSYTHLLMGAVVAIAAVLQVSRIGAMDPANAGSGYELDSIAAVIVGGTSMSGGKGSVVGTVFGMLIIAVMNNLLNLLGVPPFLREAFKGAIIIAAVLLQRKSSDN